MHNYIFNNASEVRYEDWLHYQKLSEIVLDKTSNRALSSTAAFFGLLGINAIVGAIFTGGLTTIILGVVAALFGCATAVTVMVRFAKEDKFASSLKDLTKEQIADLKNEVRALKRGHIWKNYDKVMREYFFTEKYRKDRMAYEEQLKAEQDSKTIGFSLLAKMVDNKLSAEAKETKNGETVPSCTNTTTGKQKMFILDPEEETDINSIK